jgi:integrase
MRSDDGSIKDLGDGRFRIRITAGYDPKTGKQLRPSRTIRGTRADARRERDRMKREYGTAESVVYGNMSVADFVRDEWLPTRLPLADTTLRGYDATIRNHIEPLLSAVKLANLTKIQIEKALRSIKHPGAALNVYKMLHAALALAKESGIISQNPIAKVTKPELEPYEADVYDLDETLDVLDVFRGRDIEPGVVIMASCGPRLSEVCALDWQDLTLERMRMENGSCTFRGAFLIDDSYHRVRGHRVQKGTKTRRSKRVVAIPGFAVERLLEIRGDGRIGPLMLDRTGQRMTPDGFTSRWRRMLKPRYSKDGRLIYEPPMRFIEAKNLRHSESTILLDEGATMQAVARRRGHARESTTDQFYNRAKREADYSTAELLDKAARSAREDREGRRARPKMS